MISLQSIKQSKLYPLYFLLQFPFLLPQLIRNEGWGGAARWSQLRLQMLFGRFLDRRPGYYEQPMRPFQSRLGFPLVRRAEMLVYEEIFLERCYAFTGFAELVKQRPHTLLDFGTHHGLFSDFMLMLNPQCRVFGAEMGPTAFAVARERLQSRPNVTLHHVAIGGSARRVKVGVGVVSVEQSIYAQQQTDGFEVDVITPLEFLRRCELAPAAVTLMKMDIEGAEREVFQQPDGIAPLLRELEAFVIEIHSPADAPMIQEVCTAQGLRLAQQRGINYFFRRG
jgi:FkbM family methyltransferase